MHQNLLSIRLLKDILVDFKFFFQSWKKCAYFCTDTSFQLLWVNTKECYCWFNNFISKYVEFMLLFFDLMGCAIEMSN